MNLQSSIKILRSDSQNQLAWNYLMKRMNGQIVYQISHHLKALNMEKEDLKQEIGIFLLDRIIPRPSLRNRNNNGIRKEIDITKSEGQIYNCLCFEINNFVLRKINKNITNKDTKISFKDDNGKFYKDLNNKKITLYLKWDKEKKQFYFIDKKRYIYLDLNIKRDNVINKNPLSTNYFELTDKHEDHCDENKYDKFLYDNRLYTDNKNHDSYKEIEFEIDNTFKDSDEAQKILNYILEHDYKQGRNFVRSQEANKICNKKIKPILQQIYGLGTNKRSYRKK